MNASRQKQDPTKIEEHGVFVWFMKQVKAASTDGLHTKLQSDSICAAEHHVAAEHQQQEHTARWEEGREGRRGDGVTDS